MQICACKSFIRNGSLWFSKIGSITIRLKSGRQSFEAREDTPLLLINFDLNYSSLILCGDEKVNGVVRVLLGNVFTKRVFYLGFVSRTFALRKLKFETVENNDIRKQILFV